MEINDNLPAPTSGGRVVGAQSRSTLLGRGLMAVQVGYDPDIDGLTADELYKKGLDIAQKGWLAILISRRGFSLLKSGGDYAESVRDDRLKVLKAAYKYMLAAATLGSIGAMLWLGDYFKCVLNTGQAKFWLEKAANLGGDGSQHALAAFLYKEGDGDESDFEAAAAWFRKAAMQGNEEAQFQLGEMYRKGHGVVQDFGLAAHWYRQADCHQSAYALWVMCRNGAILGSKTDALEYWYKTTFLDCKAEDIYAYGLCYYFGEGLNVDVDAAHYLFSKSAELGHSEAQYFLASIYRDGEDLF